MILLKALTSSIATTISASLIATSLVALAVIIVLLTSTPVLANSPTTTVLLMFLPICLAEDLEIFTPILFPNLVIEFEQLQMQS